jgi:hypothetical protein
VRFADWLVEAITGWSMGHGNDRTMARLEGVASQAAYGEINVPGGLLAHTTSGPTIGRPSPQSSGI